MRRTDWNIIIASRFDELLAILGRPGLPPQPALPVIEHRELPARCARQVRDGANAQGLQVSERDRVPAQAIAEYEAALLMVVPL